MLEQASWLPAHKWVTHCLQWIWHEAKRRSACVSPPFPLLKMPEDSSLLDPAKISEVAAAGCMCVSALTAWHAWVHSEDSQLLSGSDHNNSRVAVAVGTEHCGGVRLMGCHRIDGQEVPKLSWRTTTAIDFWSTFSD